MLPSHPILSCAETAAWEQRLFGGDEAREWPAMQAAGAALARAVQRDAAEIGGLGDAPRLLVLAGKGHNGGDALLAAGHLLDAYPRARADLWPVFGEQALRPLAARVWRDLMSRHHDRIRLLSRPEPVPACDLVLDGVFGFQFRPPAGPDVTALLQAVNAASIRFRVAVDLPSADVFQADVTYATGVVKAPVLGSPRAGRVRYLDLGFFEEENPIHPDRVLDAGRILGPLRGWRAPLSDKRTFGHVFVVAGSLTYPGAALMATLAALRSGAGLVTAFVPEPLVPAFAARAPEAMWVGLPTTPEGGLALEGEHLIRERLARATAAVIGPGLGSDRETRALAMSLTATLTVPVVLDADALQPDILHARRGPTVLTPHAGEFARLAAGRSPAEVAGAGTVLVLKGPVTRIFAGGHAYHALAGGPVLARGGSGDLLAGLTGGLLAQAPADPDLAAARGVLWQGLAAEHLARTQGPVAVATTQWLDSLAPALRDA